MNGWFQLMSFNCKYQKAQFFFLCQEHNCVPCLGNPYCGAVLMQRLHFLCLECTSAAAHYRISCSAEQKWERSRSLELLHHMLT